MRRDSRRRWPSWNLWLVENVKTLLAPVFILFDYTQIAGLTWADVVERFIAGNVS